ncbi:MAG: MFS transporter [Gammaproteobacteria bacterium]|nr:MAG: MFS transporter [Gammaproteobacteria bacterium]
MVSRRAALAWALYDWGNSAFATVVMAGFFPLFLRDFWSAGEASGTVTFRLGLVNAAASLLILATAPLLGAVADRAGARKRFLAGLALLGVAATAALAWIPAGGWPLALGAYLLATLGFMGANVFYDALLQAVCAPREYDRVSSLGFALGYLGGGLLFAGCAYLALHPQRLGLPDRAAAVRLAFTLTAAWWLVFTLPLLGFVPEARGPRGALHAWRAGWRQLADTFAHLRRYRPLLQFLLAYWLYIDGVDTIVRMAVDFGRAIGLEPGDLMRALLVTQFVGFPAALAYGRLGERWGTRPALLAGIAAYGGITLWAMQVRQAGDFLVLAVLVGLVQGGVQALSRSLYARLVPPERAAEFFGFYNMLGKFAALLGPLLVGLTAYATGDPRRSLVSLLVLFATGGGLLARLKLPPAGRGGGAVE